MKKIKPVTKIEKNTRNRPCITIIVLSVVPFFVLALIGCIYLVPILGIVDSQTNEQETFLISSQSPDGTYDLEAYRTEPGATVDFSIRVYVISNNQKKLIYDTYHEYDVQIDWINHSTVSINGRMLDLAQGETYDCRE